MMLRKPCDNCPFVRGGSFQLSGLSRASEIADGLRADRSFDCHKTTRETGNGQPQHCYGAMKVIWAEGGANQMMRIYLRLGVLTEEQIESEPTDCYESLDEWVEAMV